MTKDQNDSLTPLERTINNRVSDRQFGALMAVTGLGFITLATLSSPELAAEIDQPAAARAIEGVALEQRRTVGFGLVCIVLGGLCIRYGETSDD